MVILFPLSTLFTDASVAKSFLDNIYKLHGLPSIIISDRDKIFTSTLWKELFRLAEVNLRMSTSYHPQSDGQTECLNQTMETYLHCFVNACPSKWINWLSSVEFWYNTSVHSATRLTPFKALYGYEPRHFEISSLDVVSSMELKTWMEEKEVMVSLLKQHLACAKLRMKKQVDQHQSE
jgi:hypothetical protein